MKKQNPTLLLYPLEKAERFSNRFLFIGRFLSKLIFSLRYDLKKAELSIDPEKYCLASFISALIYGFLFFFIGAAFGVIITKGFGLETILIMITLGIIVFVSTLIFHLFYPKIHSYQIAAMVDQELLFALRTLLIQLSSGISLFEAIKSISRSNYGQVSAEFENVVKDINSGASETAALEKLALEQSLKS